MISYGALVQFFTQGFQGGLVFNGRAPYVLGADVPQDGEHGASVLANDSDYGAGDAVRAFLVAPPGEGVIRFYPDGSGYWEPGSGDESFAAYEAYVNGQSIGQASIRLVNGPLLEGMVVVAEHELRWSPVSEHTIRWNARPPTGV